MHISVFFTMSSDKLHLLILIYFVQAPSSPSSPIANEPKYEKRWLDTLSVPLSMARISRYKSGTDKLRFVIQKGKHWVS